MTNFILWLWCQFDYDCCKHLLEGCVWSTR